MRFKIEYENGQQKFLYEDTNSYYKEDLESAVDKFLKMVDAPIKSAPISTSVFNIISGGGASTGLGYNTGNIQIQDLFMDSITTWEPITEVQPGDSISLEDMV